MWEGAQTKIDAGKMCGEGNAREKLRGHGGTESVTLVQSRGRGRGKLGIFQEEAYLN